jgi:regulator of RNase E activity RraA
MSELAPLGDAVKAQLATVCAATIATELFNRGLRNCFLYGLKPLNPAHCRFVGEAFTLRFIPSREDVDNYQIYHKPGHPQRVAIESCPPGHALVMDCRNDPLGASAGDILIERLMRRGAAAAITDGAFRDSPTIAKLPFPSFAAGQSPNISLARHHAVDMQVPIACAGVAVYPGDVLVGEEEGVMVIPRHLAAEIAAGAVERDLSEAFVMEKIRAGASITGVYPFSDAAKREYEAWKAMRNTTAV